VREVFTASLSRNFSLEYKQNPGWTPIADLPLDLPLGAL